MLAYSRTNDAEMAFLGPAPAGFGPIGRRPRCSTLKENHSSFGFAPYQRPIGHRTVVRVEFVHAAWMKGKGPA